MRRATLIMLSGILGLTALVVPSRAAFACDYDPPVTLSLEMLVAATDLEDLNSVDGPFAVAENAARRQLGVEPLQAVERLPRIVSLEHRRTVAFVEPPPRAYSSPAAVQVRDAVWGSVAGHDRPIQRNFDTSSCADDFHPPQLGEDEWVVKVDEAGAISAWVTFTPEDDQLTAAKDELTRLFGEPVRPEIHRWQIEVAMDDLRRSGEATFGQPMVEATFVEEAAADDENIGRDGPNFLALLPSFALVGVALLGAIAVATRVFKSAVNR